MHCYRITGNQIQESGNACNRKAEEVYSVGRGTSRTTNMKMR
jgi:hypothetical protein